jgi:hypothetical protein
MLISPVFERVGQDLSTWLRKLTDSKIYRKKAQCSEDAAQETFSRHRKLGWHLRGSFTDGDLRPPFAAGVE